MKKNILILLFSFSFLFMGCGIRIIDIEEENNMFNKNSNIEVENSMSEIQENNSNIDIDKFIEEDIDKNIDNQLFYGKIVEIIDNKLCVYLNVGKCILTTNDSIDDFNIGDYISFKSNGMMMLSYPAQMSAENIQKIDFLSYIQSFNDFSDNFVIPYEDKDTGFIIYESEIIDEGIKDKESSNYIGNTYNGPVSFQLDYPTDYEIGNYVDFYTDGVLLESYPAQINQVYDSELVIF